MPMPASATEPQTSANELDAHDDARAQAQRLARSRSTSTRSCARSSRCCVGLCRRRRDARRDQDDQRPLRRRDHARAGPAVDPDRGGADRRGAANMRGSRRGCWRRTSTRRCATRRSTRSRSRSRAGAAPGLIANALLATSSPANARKLNDAIDRRARPRVRILRPAHALRPLPAAATRRRALVIETPQQFFLRIACALADDGAGGARALSRCSRSLEYLPSSPTLFNAGTRHEQLSSCFLLDSPAGSPGVDLRAATRTSRCCRSSRAASAWRTTACARAAR